MIIIRIRLLQLNGGQLNLNVAVREFSTYQASYSGQVIFQSLYELHCRECTPRNEVRIRFERSLVENTGPSRSKEVTTEEMIEKIHYIVLDDLKVEVHEIAETAGRHINWVSGFNFA